MRWLALIVVLGSLSITPTASAACGSPTLRIANGAAPTTNNVYITYKGQMVSVEGTGWASCTERLPGSCIHETPLAPQRSISLWISKASRENLATESASWKPRGRTVLVGTFDANERYSFDLPAVAVPTRSGNYVVMTTDPDHSDPTIMAAIRVL